MDFKLIKFKLEEANILYQINLNYFFYFNLIIKI